MGRTLLSAAFDLDFQCGVPPPNDFGDPETKTSVKSGGQGCLSHMLLVVAAGRLILRNCSLLLFQQFDALGKSQVRRHKMEITIDLG